MAEEWLLVYQTRWYTRMLGGLYGIIVGLFMAIIGLGGMGLGIAHLLGFATINIDKTRPLWQSYATLAGGILCGAWLGWNGLRDTWTLFLDVFTPSLVHDGILDQFAVEMRQGKNTKYPVWVLKSADKAWEIYKRSLDHSSHNKRIEVGRQVRIQYQRGTNQITGLWVKPKEERIRRN